MPRREAGVGACVCLRSFEVKRYIGEISADGTTIIVKWEFSEDGKSWRMDFDSMYTWIG